MLQILKEVNQNKKTGTIEITTMNLINLLSYIFMKLTDL